MTNRDGLAIDRAAIDAALVARCATGDQTAFREIYDQYIELVLAICLRICRQHTDAHEIASVVFVEIWNHPNRFRPDRGSFRTYIGLLSRSRAMDHVRRATTLHKHHRQLKRNQQAEQESMQHRLDPAVQSAAVETEHLISENLAALPAELRVILKMSFYEGSSHREIAEQLELPLGTVKSRVRRALKLLGNRIRTVNDSVAHTPKPMED